MESRIGQETGVGETIEEAGEQAKASAGELAARARRASERLGEAWENARTNIQDKTIAGARVTDRAIRENPYTSLGVAFGLGVLIGVLVNRGR
jgi:ElaB/YqjD/DUF883 family membrane-anchored ribosome-binding protein